MSHVTGWFIHGLRGFEGLCDPVRVLGAMTVQHCDPQRFDPTRDSDDR